MADTNTTTQQQTTTTSATVENATVTGQNTVKKHIDATMGTNDKGEVNQKISDNGFFKIGIPVAAGLASYFLGKKLTGDNKLLSAGIGLAGAWVGSKVLTETVDDAQHAFGQGNDGFFSKLGRFGKNIITFGGQSEADIEETVQTQPVDTGAEVSV